MLHRYSSRQVENRNQTLGQSFLNEKLKHAVAYDRIAGYFSPSILQIAGEALEAIPRVRIICNSQITFRSINVGNHISDAAFRAALWREWTGEQIEKKDVPVPLLQRLFHLIDSGRLEIRILPDDRFGLIHGKAGVITFRDGSKTSFIGSANESFQGWRLNYELVWEDDSPESIAWVQSEFDALWGDPAAYPLTRTIVEDIHRISIRTVQTIEEWRDEPNPAAPVVESPVYRQQGGLWNHQKYFVQRAFEEHRKYGGARLVLADQVGLGKTLQLAMAAQLMALYGAGPVLIIAPRTLLQQWQGEMWSLLEVPSAYWNGAAWIDENGIEYEKGSRQILKCPRRIAIVSQGLITRGSEASAQLLKRQYECVILDEAHRARVQRNLAGDDRDGDPAAPGNNLFQFMKEISSRTKSMLLATATPVQLHPIEAWDLLNLLNQWDHRILGDAWSPWNRPGEALTAVLDANPRSLTLEEFWQYVRNPLPPEEEKTREGSRDFRSFRQSLSVSSAEFLLSQESLNQMSPSDRDRLQQLRQTFFADHNPFIRTIVRRTRHYLEETIDPETGKPYLERVRVRLLGENDDEALDLNPYQRDAYEEARKYCAALRKEKRGTGFLETLLLRRIGSSMEAGRLTAETLLHGRLKERDLFESDDDEDEIEAQLPETGQIGEHLKIIIDLLESNVGEDPKYQRILDILSKGVNGTEPWLERGCIIFSGYYDSARWLAERLSADLTEETIALYAGSGRSALYRAGRRESVSRDEIKDLVWKQRVRLLIGTDAASEGLNLQILGSLINLDLPWNPTRLEQRKGRIQRIGQKYSEVYVYNLRYRGSVEDTVHQVLSARLESINNLFGQLPDTLEDVWVLSARGELEEAQKRIDRLPDLHPFDLRYNVQASVDGPSWEQCASVLNSINRREALEKGWE